jgi:hypothetical protein
LGLNKPQFDKLLDYFQFLSKKMKDDFIDLSAISSFRGDCRFYFSNKALGLIVIIKEFGKA